MGIHFYIEVFNVYEIYPGACCEGDSQDQQMCAAVTKNPRSQSLRPIKANSYSHCRFIWGWLGTPGPRLTEHAVGDPVGLAAAGTLSHRDSPLAVQGFLLEGECLCSHFVDESKPRGWEERKSGKF